MIAKSRFLIVYAALIAVALYINLHKDMTVPTNRPFTEFPVQHNSWKMASQAEFSQQVLDVLKPTDYISRQYVSSEGGGVGLYIGYHGGGKGTGGIHSPKHCLPGGGWFEESSKREKFSVQGGSIDLVRSVYRKGDSREMFLYWFQVQGATLSDEYSLKLAEIKNSMLKRRRDSAFIRISVPVEGNVELAAARGEMFVKDFYPLIQQFLPR